MMLSFLTPDLFGWSAQFNISSVCSDRFLISSNRLNLYLDA
jgi:hypothetical protein